MSPVFETVKLSLVRKLERKRFLEQWQERAVSLMLVFLDGLIMEYLGIYQVPPSRHDISRLMAWINIILENSQIEYPHPSHSYSCCVCGFCKHK